MGEYPHLPLTFIPQSSPSTQGQSLPDASTSGSEQAASSRTQRHPRKATRSGEEEEALREQPGPGAPSQEAPSPPPPTTRDADKMFRTLLPRGGGRELHRVMPTGVKKASHETGYSFLIF